jgi:hypothetical protein
MQSVSFFHEAAGCRPAWAARQTRCCATLGVLAVVQDTGCECHPSIPVRTLLSRASKVSSRIEFCAQSRRHRNQLAASTLRLLVVPCLVYELLGTVGYYSCRGVIHIPRQGSQYSGLAWEKTIGGGRRPLHPPSCQHDRTESAMSVRKGARLKPTIVELTGD